MDGYQSCECNNNNCTKCKDDKIKKMTEKIGKYEKVLSDINDLMFSESKANYNPMEESIIILDDSNSVDGEYHKKIKSKIGESFYIFENGKDMEELNIKDKEIIYRQDDYSKYNKTCTNFEKFNNIYGWGMTVVGYGKWLVGIL